MCNGKTSRQQYVFAGYEGWLNCTVLNPFLVSAQAKKGWTVQHDKILLLAVRKHGFGRWLDIAQDPEFGLYTMLAEPAVPAGQLLCHQPPSRSHCHFCRALIMTIDPCVTVALRLLCGADSETFVRVRDQREYAG